MKRILLLLTILSTAYWASAQIIVAGISPSNIEGNYEFTWADPAGGDWATPDFNIPGTFVQAEIMLVDDGSTGTNPQGNPISAEGCLPLVNDLTGKIAMIYRNTCEFGAKALNAQNAGAVGVIIINRDPEVVEMGGGAEGINVTIPTCMLQLADGQTLLAEAANGPTVVFMGNRAGIYDNDLNTRPSRIFISKSYGVPSQLSLDASEFNFEMGLTVYNLGQSNADSVYVNATVTDPSSSVVYDETVGPFSMLAVNGLAIDSVNIMPDSTLSFPAFSLASYDEGTYSVMYSVYNGSATDDFPGDNMISSDFEVNSEVFSYSSLDAELNPAPNNFYRASGVTAFTSCLNFSDANAGRLAAEGMTFAASNNTFELIDELVGIEVYKWNDEFVDLADPNVGFSALEPLISTSYIYTEDLQDTPVYAEFETPIYLEDGARYLFCAATFNENIFFGYDTKTQYIYNQNQYLQPISVISADGTWNSVGFGADITPGIAVHIIDTADVVIPEDTNTGGGVGINATDSKNLNLFAYPNPTRDVVTIAGDISGIANLTISDISGKTVSQGQITLNNGMSTVNVSALDNGMYIFNVVTEDGRVSKFNIIKQ